MLEGVEQPVVSPDYINRLHPSLEGIRGTARIESVKAEPLSQGRWNQLMRAIEHYPVEKWRRTRIKEMPTLKAAVISADKSEELPDKPVGEGYVLLAGSLHTSAGESTMGAELYKEAVKRTGNVDMVAVVSSAVSNDTKDSAVSSNPVERAAYEVSLIIDLLKKHPTERLNLIGYSLGGTDLGYLLPLLEDMLQQNNIQTKIGGVLFLQSGSLMKQSPLEIAKSAGSVNAKIYEGADLFPTAENVTDLDRRIEEAQVKFDTGEVLRLREVKARMTNAYNRFPSFLDIADVSEQLEEAKSKADFGRTLQLQAQKRELETLYKEPQFGTPDEERALKQIDRDIENAYFSKDKKRIRKLVSKRNLTLKPIVDRYIEMADTQKEPFGLRDILRLSKVTVAPFLTHLGSLFPKELRATFTSNVGILTGTTDRYFPTEEVANSMRKREGTENDHFFPHAQAVLEASAEGWAHMGGMVHPDKFAYMAIDMLQRMNNANQESAENTHPPQQITYT